MEQLQLEELCRLLIIARDEQAHDHPNGSNSVAHNVYDDALFITKARLSTLIQMELAAKEEYDMATYDGDNSACE